MLCVAATPYLIITAKIITMQKMHFAGIKNIFKYLYNIIIIIKKSSLVS